MLAFSAARVEADTGVLALVTGPEAWLGEGAADAGVAVGVTVAAAAVAAIATGVVDGGRRC